ncbi:response regulator [Bordetella sp. 2513F-2]
MPKIYVVDDEPINVDLWREYLSSYGYDVSTSTDGVHALQQMVALRPDLVITDLSMPGMNGGSLLAAMRENAYLSDVPVMVVSGHSKEEASAQCPGHQAFLRKPVDADVLVAAVRQLLAAHVPHAQAPVQALAS